MKLHKVVYGTLGFLFGVSSVGFFALARLGDDALFSDWDAQPLDQPVGDQLVQADFGTDDE